MKYKLSPPPWMEQEPIHLDAAALAAALTELFRAEQQVAHWSTGYERAKLRYETALAACRVALKPEWSK